MRLVVLGGVVIVLLGLVLLGLCRCPMTVLRVWLISVIRLRTIVCRLPSLVVSLPVAPLVTPILPWPMNRQSVWTAETYSSPVCLCDLLLPMNLT